MVKKKTRILLITGRDAFNDLLMINWGNLITKYEIEIVKAQVPIISLITKKKIETTLSSFEYDKFDLVITSGLIPWDLSKINSPFSSKIKKGPRFLANLPEILKNFDPFNLSSQIPADKLYTFSKEQNLDLLIDKNRRKFKELDKKNGFYLSKSESGVIFSPILPPVVIGEIIDAPKLSFEELSNKIEKYQKNGVSIIDIGSISDENHSKEIFDLISRLKSKFQIPFSIDSINPEEIHSAINAGAQMVLSVTIDNYEELLDLDKDIVLVIIPNSEKDSKSLSTEIKMDRLINLYKILRKKGFTKILMDPITGVPISPGFSPTIEILISLRKKIDLIFKDFKNYDNLPKPQLFMGFGNVTELIDGDSSGINTLLSIIAVELGVSAILSTEYSNKCRNNLRELIKSIKLAYYANQMHVPPLNLGITAFQFKNKQEFPKYMQFGEPLEKIQLEDRPAIMDPKGYFKIYIDEEKNQILITHFNNSVNFMDATLTLVGDNAESLYKTIISRKLVSRLDHAAYLGKELIKAELALKIGIPYSQS
ncbi:MAG: dihydropteroate synthase-like protein [Promethearchaeota archaeon]